MSHAIVPGRTIVLPAIIVLLLAISPSASSLAQGSVQPPPQPAGGPGGSEYRFDVVSKTRVGESPTGAWVFAPEGVSVSERVRLPVVLFLHGFGATDPGTYLGWIAHLVRRGNAVIYPDYQPAGFLVFDQPEFVPNMLTGIASALATAGLEPGSLHVVGHSLGAVLGTAYITAGPVAGLPPAGTLTVIEPGGCGTCTADAGADDTFVGGSDALAIWRRLDDIPPDRKRMVSVRSDRYGAPDLVADHLFPQTGGFGGEEDALDWYGLWRPLDGLIDCFERGDNCNLGLGTAEADLFMGRWSDGAPVTLPAPLYPTPGE